MKIKSQVFGEQTVDPDTIITFPRGIPGFEDQTRFKLFHQEGKQVIYWLQSLDDEDLIFSVAQPSTFNINYNFELSDDETTLLQTDLPDEILILIILHKDESTPTIKGSINSPLLINSVKRIGFQKVLVFVEQSITLTETRNQIELSERAQALGTSQG
ncbi:MAG: flagellar assembly protein FliW [Methylococcaceae bacterium]|jgi:flagellar assembly factor FliW